MISEYRKLLEQNTQITQQAPLMQQLPFQMTYNFPASTVQMPPKASTQQPQLVIQNPKYSANKSHKEYQPFYIPAPVDGTFKEEKREVKRENLDHFVVFKRGNESLPKGILVWTQLNLSVELAGEQFLIQLSKKFLQDFEKTFKDFKQMDKKRTQLHKTLKGVQELTRKIKDSKKSKEKNESETSQFDLLQQIDNGLKLDLAQYFIDLSKYNCQPLKTYDNYQESDEGQKLFNQCLQLIE